VSENNVKDDDMSSTGKRMYIEETGINDFDSDSSISSHYWDPEGMPQSMDNTTLFGAHPQLMILMKWVRFR
jgi:hypothetical protein